MLEDHRDNATGSCSRGDLESAIGMEGVSANSLAVKIHLKLGVMARMASKPMYADVKKSTPGIAYIRLHSALRYGNHRFDWRKADEV